MRDRLLEFLPVILATTALLVFAVVRPAQPDSRSAKVAPAAAPTVAPARSRPAVPTPASAPVCNPATPRFVNSMARLRAALGSSMGDALECEQQVDALGNREQRTTMGLAYYRVKLNLACFTTGWEHWALRDDGAVVHWSGDEVEPPPEANSTSG